MESNKIVAAAMREALVAKKGLIVELLGLDADLGEAETYAEIIRACAFERQLIRNPVVVFQERLNNGEFLPVQEYEDAAHLPVRREPLTDEELDARADWANERSVYWAGEVAVTPAKLVANIMLYS